MMMSRNERPSAPAEGLGAPQSHRCSATTVDFDQRGALERFVAIGRRQMIPRGHVAGGLEVGAANCDGPTARETLMRAAEAPDRVLGLTRRPHLVFGRA
jgi:hypothetical protein